jgi:hypothetical protein
MLRGMLIDPKFRAKLSDAIKPDAHYLTSKDETLNPFEVIMDGHLIRMGYIAWRSWGRSNRERTAEAVKNN